MKFFKISLVFLMSLFIGIGALKAVDYPKMDELNPRGGGWCYVDNNGRKTIGLSDEDYKSLSNMYNEYTAIVAFVEGTKAVGAVPDQFRAKKEEMIKAIIDEAKKQATAKGLSAEQAALVESQIKSEAEKSKAPISEEDIVSFGNTLKNGIKTMLEKCNGSPSDKKIRKSELAKIDAEYKKVKASKDQIQKTIKDFGTDGGIFKAILNGAMSKIDEIAKENTPKENPEIVARDKKISELNDNLKNLQDSLTKAIALSDELEKKGKKAATPKSTFEKYLTNDGLTVSALIDETEYGRTTSDAELKQDKITLLDEIKTSLEAALILYIEKTITDAIDKEIMEAKKTMVSDKEPFDKEKFMDMKGITKLTGAEVFANYYKMSQFKTVRYHIEYITKYKKIPFYPDIDKEFFDKVNGFGDATDGAIKECAPMFKKYAGAVRDLYKRGEAELFKTVTQLKKESDKNAASNTIRGKDVATKDDAAIFEKAWALIKARFDKAKTVVAKPVVVNQKSPGSMAPQVGMAPQQGGMPQPQQQPQQR